MRLRKSLGMGAIGVAAMLGVLVWIYRPPPLPALVAGASDGNGVGDACGGPIAADVSPEFNRRLAEQFPPGSESDRLVRTLVAQGFRETHAPCANDPAIKSAYFCGRYAWRFGPRATVFWKADTDGKLLMTGGALFYVC